MNKFFTTALAVTMTAATLGATAFAAESPTTLDKDKQSVSIPVTGEYVAEQPSAEIISVDVEWESMNFKYAAAQQGTWNPTTHTYINPVTSGEWLNRSSNITVTNHSNIDVTASFKFKAADPDGSIFFTFDNASLDLDAGKENAFDDAAKGVVAVSLSSQSDRIRQSQDLGTITVSVEKKATN